MGEPAAKKPLDICFVAPSAYPMLVPQSRIEFVGGAELQQTLLARALAARGHRVSMVCLDYGQPDAVNVDGITVYKAHTRHAGLPVVRFLHPRLTSVWRAMRRADADIYYQRSAGMITGVVAAFCRRHGRHSIYAAAHDRDFAPGRQFIRFRRDRWLFEYGLRRVHTILVQTPLQQHLCAARYGRTARVVRNCYPPRSNASRDPNGPVLWVGTIRPFKRPELFLELARRLPRRRLVMVGGVGGTSGEERAFFQHIQGQAAEIPNLDFAGFVPLNEVESYFDAAAVFVNTSDEEGFPNTFLQAWARGMPTVTLLKPNLSPRNAAICTPAGDVDGAAAAVETLLDDRNAWLSAGDRCRRYFLARHLPEVVVGKLERILANVGHVGRG